MRRIAYGSRRVIKSDGFEQVEAARRRLIVLYDWEDRAKKVEAYDFLVSFGAHGLTYYMYHQLYSNH